METPLSVVGTPLSVVGFVFAGPLALCCMTQRYLRSLNTRPKYRRMQISLQITKSHKEGLATEIDMTNYMGIVISIVD